MSKILSSQEIKIKHSKLYYRSLELLGSMAVMLLLAIVAYVSMFL